MTFISTVFSVNSLGNINVLLSVAIELVDLHPEFGVVAGVSIWDHDLLHVVLDPNFLMGG